MGTQEKILIVDDQPENISIMVEALQSRYTLVAATDGETALERVHDDPMPDLILLDVMMPNMSGHEVCRILKENPKTRDIPVIFVTALDNPDDEAKGLALGAVDYITKPISPPVVEARVRAHLQLRQARRVLMEQNDVLEKRVEERTREVVKAQEERVESLNNFANAMAHQIRNPVTAIGGLAGLLIKKMPEDSPLIEYARGVRQNSLRLEDMVGVISHYVSMAAAESVSTSSRILVDKAVNEAREFAQELGRELECDISMGDEYILCDPDLAAQALGEVLRNAVEFSADNRVSIIIRDGMDLCQVPKSATEAFYKTKCRYGISITDKGPGILENDLPYATDPFFTTKASGVGLGLTRVKRIMTEELGGSMHIESAPGMGVTVILNFCLGG